MQKLTFDLGNILMALTLHQLSLWCTRHYNC